MFAIQITRLMPCLNLGQQDRAIMESRTAIEFVRMMHLGTARWPSSEVVRCQWGPGAFIHVIMLYIVAIVSTHSGLSNYHPSLLMHHGLSSQNQDYQLPHV